MEETTRLRTAPIGYVAGWRASAGWRMFFGSPLAVVATAWLAMIVVVALAGPYLFADEANQQNLALRFFPPFSLDRGLAFVLGADSLGRPILLQLVIGAQHLRDNRHRRRDDFSHSRLCHRANGRLFRRLA